MVVVGDEREAATDFAESGCGCGKNLRDSQQDTSTRTESPQQVTGN